ncbi:hypothetical protein SAMN05192551_102224 [Tindallia magadiensis]|uniref:Uncharacterized protein n=2 Tax=Tindallia magadiensis TaxID=69895 RepID=A0A1I3C6B4_9FIRM|nr:hypothetical protein SAMN05192551_102224 [Tindallia magadiensis]
MGYLDIFLFLISLLMIYWLIRELTRQQWAGNLLKKPATQHKNMSFYLWILLLFFWVYYAGEFLRALQEAVLSDDIIPESELSDLITRGITSTFWILFSWVNTLRAKHQPALHEKGFFVSEGFVPWKNLRWTQWNDEGHLELIYSPTLPTPFAKEIRRVWKIKLEEIEEVQQLLELNAPRSVGQVLVDEKGKPKNPKAHKVKK